MEFKAYAKINLALDVIGKREDGYHILKMIMQTIDLYDIVRVSKKSSSGIKLESNTDKIPLDNTNIAYKAAELFIKTYDINSGVNIYIEKNIPVEAGLAGGSTDAATVLKAMRNIFKPDLTDKKLAQIGVKIGADVPYCIFGKTALCEGIGEKVTPIKHLKGNILVLVKPNFGVSSREVYEEIDKSKLKNHPNTDIVLKSIRNEDFKLLYSNLGNILESVVLDKHPVVSQIKKEILNFKGLCSLMSGSGPTVFGIFEDMLSAQKCYDYMKTKYDEVFITRTI
ncbi:4-(cytidine 5'-diphospho)-2-C-methyl-D-erythritol kinase [Clostridium rectalis]|uniref:4-(cytidine 5'-diphospho)-2-C-methyl-D-erythritol kinase n=1 Tax=Clostridium rectalis TaxID=2040295 RepID=UPI000F6403C1|nr:4-(cytidine 5'-diphospho)-2-C-methyl-D-erythritol kinase [Clostridium rectalis]